METRNGITRNQKEGLTMKAKAKVFEEFYRIVDHGHRTLKDRLKYDDVYREAFKIVGEKGGTVCVQRVTIVSTPDDDFWKVFGDGTGKTEAITGSVSVGVPHFATDPLGRYHPVNGWVIPDEIDEG
jgi:hypothetical protein